MTVASRETRPPGGFFVSAAVETRPAAFPLTQTGHLFETAVHPSADAIQLVKASEGCRLTAYRCPAGVLTIGYGHTRGVNAGQVITQDDAELLLESDLDDAADAVRSLVTVALTQGQFDALCDFVFNLGAGRLRDSTLLRLLNQGRYAEAAAQFKFWVMSAGQALPGLVTRRAAERTLFERRA